MTSLHSASVHTSNTTRTGDVNLDPVAEQSYSFPLFRAVGKEVTPHSSPPGEAQYAHMLLSILLLERFVPPPLPPSLSYFFRLVQTDGYLFYTSVYNPLFCCLNSSSWSSFSRLPCLFGAYRIIAFLFACPFLLILAL